MMLALGRPLPPGVGSVSQWFGEHPENYAAFGLAGHEGLDYACPAGSPVLAAHAGRVVQAHDDGPYGLHVLILADDGRLCTVYAHLQAVLVTGNERVTAGMQVGNAGSSGRSTGPHLHFGVKVAGVRNPAYGDWLDPVLFRLAE